MPDIRRRLPTFRVGLFLAVSLLFHASDGSAQDRIYVSSRGTDEIRIYDAAGRGFLRTLEDARPDRQRPQEILFAENGSMYVTFIAGEGNRVIHEYDPLTGDYLGAFSSGYTLDAPTKMRFGPDGHIYVSQWGGLKFNVAVFDGQTGEFIREATNDDSRLNLMGLAWDDMGRLYVSHWGDNGSSGFVRRIDTAGNATTVIDSSVLDGPVNLWFNDDGTLNVVDWTRGRVDVFDVSNGSYVRTRATGIPGGSRFEGWTIGPDGLLYVCDWLRGEINRYDPDSGDKIDTFIDDPGLVNPNSIKFGPAMDLSAAGEASEMPVQAELVQNYPNPFTVSTTISYSVPVASRVRLTVADLLGRQVSVLVDDVRAPGEYSVPFEATGLPSGIYIYRLVAGSAARSRVMTVMP